MKNLINRFLYEQNEEIPDENQQQMPPDSEQNMDDSLPPDEQNMDYQDPNSMGNGMDQPVEDPEYIGKKYELKKIYNRLITIQQYLSDVTDEQLIKLRIYVSDSLEMFETIISNIESYKDQLDNIIVMFYKLLMIIYALLKDYYETRKNDKINEFLTYNIFHKLLNEQIKLKKGKLHLPKNKKIDKVSLKTFEKKIPKQSWNKLSKRITALKILNKNRNPELSHKMDKLQKKLSDYVDKKRKNNPNFGD